MLQAVRDNWYALIPAEANAPELKSGTLVIEFRIQRDGRVTGMKIVSSSGDIALDRAAWGGITASNPFVPLPAEFTGPYLALRFRFRYNPKNRSRKQHFGHTYPFPLFTFGALAYLNRI